jgi:hypothetical protein
MVSNKSKNSSTIHRIWRKILTVELQPFYLGSFRASEQRFLLTQKVIVKFYEQKSLIDQRLSSDGTAIW